MQPLFHTATLAGAALVVLALSAAAYADGNGSNNLGNGPHHTLNLTERTSSFIPLDLGTPGAGPGDQFTGTGDLLDAAGNKVGTSIFTCITAAVGIRQCSQVYELADGKITTTGTAHVSGTTSPLWTLIRHPRRNLPTTSRPTPRPASAHPVPSASPLAPNESSRSILFTFFLRELCRRTTCPSASVGNATAGRHTCS